MEQLTNSKKINHLAKKTLNYFLSKWTKADPSTHSRALIRFFLVQMAIASLCVKLLGIHTIFIILIPSFLGILRFAACCWEESKWAAIKFYSIVFGFLILISLWADHNNIPFFGSDPQISFIEQILGLHFVTYTQFSLFLTTLLITFFLFTGLILGVIQYGSERFWQIRAFCIHWVCRKLNYQF